MLLVAISLILSPGRAVGVLRRIRPDTSWAMPRGVIELKGDGSVRLKKVRKKVNACLKAKDWGGSVEALSNPGTAYRAVDGRLDTWWSPDPKDPVEKWRLKVDLGRAIASKKVRLIFVDTLGFKPFERFSVYVSNGVSAASKKVPAYRLVGKETIPNRSRVVEYKIIYQETQETTEAGERLIKALDLDLVRFVYITIDVPNSVGTPGLAEVEVEAVGDNVAFLTDENGGGITPYQNIDSAPCVYDGDAGSWWTFTPVADTEWDKGPSERTRAACFEWDLGATFWVDQIYLDFGWYGYYAGARFSGNLGTPYGYVLMTSDGSPRPGGPLDWPPGQKFAYQLVADVENKSMPYQFHFNHEFEPRKVRHIFFRMAHGFMYWGRGSVQLVEMQIFGEGYPAEAVLTSQPVDLAKLAGGGGSKFVSLLRWEAEQPLFPATRVEVRTRSGDELDTLRVYYKKLPGGRLKETTEQKYYKLPKPLRGPIKVKGFRPGEGWSGWSRAYPQEGPFLSPSPRRFVQFQVRLITDVPDTAPTFKGLYIDIAEPLVRKCRGAVEPREVREVDRPLSYRYKIWPEAGPGDRGFDQILIIAPVLKDEVSLRIGGKAEPLGSNSVRFGADSLLVRLPRTVKGDSVEVGFKAKVSRNGLSFDAFLGRFGVWQKVDPSGPEATTIFLPGLAEKKDLIWNLRVTDVLTPNGDGTNDVAEITFSLLKVEGKEPDVEIYDLGGHLVRRLSKGEKWKYSWDGRDGSGELVPPGVYICRIRARSDAGDHIVNRAIGVVY